jgi:hypothetical protein
MVVRKYSIGIEIVLLKVKSKKGPLTADQNNLMLPAEMPMDKTANDGRPPNNEDGIALPDATGSGRNPLAPALKSNGDKMLLFHIKILEASICRAHRVNQKETE